MKPRLRSYDPFATLDMGVTTSPRPATLPQALTSERMNGVQGRSKLERCYPAMARAIELLWGYPEMNEYFAKLWIADGDAEPIDPEVMADLMLLARVHQDVVPTRPRATMASIYGRAYGDAPARRDVWAEVPRRR